METVLEAIHLRKSFSDFVAVHDFSLSLKTGEIVGLLGPNGAGKTTILRMLTGLIYPDSGEIKIRGEIIDEDWSEALAKIGCRIEIPAFYEYLSARTNLQLIQKLRGCTESIDSLLEKVKLLQRGNDKVKIFSQGMRQRLGMAAALLGDPEIVILDEPMNGLDPEGMIEARNLIKSLAKEQKKAILITSHLLAEMEALCDRVYILNQGKVIASGHVSELILPDDENLENLFLRLMRK